MQNFKENDQLIESLLKKEIHAIDFFYYKFRSQIFGICLKNSIDNLDAEGKFEQVFLHLIRNIQEASNINLKLNTWIILTTLKLCNDKFLEEIELKASSYLSINL